MIKYSLLIILLLIIEAYHDTYRDGILTGNVYYSFVKERKSKLIKLSGYFLACFIIYILKESLYYALFPIGARVLLFDQIEFFIKHKEFLPFKEWFTESEIYKWYLIIFKGKKQ